MNRAKVPSNMGIAIHVFIVHNICDSYKNSLTIKEEILESVKISMLTIKQPQQE